MANGASLTKTGDLITSASTSVTTTAFFTSATASNSRQECDARYNRRPMTEGWSQRKGSTESKLTVPTRIPPAADPAEAVERVISRRQLIISEGDIVITRSGGGLTAPNEVVYRLHTHGRNDLPERFATFNHAAMKGEELAARYRVCLFYFESDHDLPHLLRDARAK